MSCECLKGLLVHVSVAVDYKKDKYKHYQSETFKVGKMLKP